MKIKSFKRGLELFQNFHYLKIFQSQMFRHVSLVASRDLFLSLSVLIDTSRQNSSVATSTRFRVAMPRCCCCVYMVAHKESQ